MSEETTVIETRGVEERVFAITDVELRGGADGLVTLAGYPSTFNNPYPVHDRWGEYAETILPGAWQETLARSGNIHLLVGHGGIPIPLAATKAGTLRLAEDSHGLEFESDINPTRSGLHADVAYAVETKAMDEMSVGMRIPDGGDRWTDQNSQRWISQADLIEISVLSRGANPNTSAGLRNEDLLAEIRQLRDQLAERDDEAVTGAENAQRHIVGLQVEMARLFKRRYPR